MAAYGLYSHIRANKIRSAFLLAGLFLLVYVLVFAGALVAEAWLHPGFSLNSILWVAKYDFWRSVPFATIGAIVWIGIAYYFHQAMIDAMTGSESVTRKEEPRLYNLLENLCVARGIPMPRLKIMQSDALNAFATGLNQRQYSITVTTGLMDRLNDAELEAVLGHELTHIRNGDVRMMVIAMVIAGVVSFFGEMLFRMLTQGGLRYRSSSSSSDKKGGAVAAILIAVVLIMVAWLLSVVVRLALSRSREYLADAGAVELTKNPDAMISALRKIENRGELPGSPSAVMEMCIDNPRTGFSDLFATHPSIDARVYKLVTLAGGHDPGPIALPPLEGEEQEQMDAREQQIPQEGSQESSQESSQDKPNPWGDPPSPSGPAPKAQQGPWG
ncbi:MAG TPA: M48 family metallopeptidase [Xanthobacteraceae bacterium]|nr:M48 family metallopeptidase [Xanthobacteraceae bacterium]